MPAPAPGGVVAVEPAGIEVRAELLAGLPAVNAVPERLGLGELVASYLPEPDPRCELAPGSVRFPVCAVRAQRRLHGKYRRMVTGGKASPEAITAVARELAGFVWAEMTS